MGTNYYLVPKEVEVQKEVLKAVQEDILSVLHRAKNCISERSIDKIKLAIENLEVSADYLHIGKNSYGWRFVFASDNFDGLGDFVDKYMKNDHIILDEYGRRHYLDDFIDKVKNTLQYIDPVESALNSEGYRLVSGEFC